MPTQTQPRPVTVPVITPRPDPSAFPERFTDPLRICPQQKRELSSPDIEP